MDGAALSIELFCGHGMHSVVVLPFKGEAPCNDTDIGRKTHRQQHLGAEDAC